MFRHVSYHIIGMYRVWRMARSSSEDTPSPRRAHYHLPRQWALEMGRDLLLKRHRSIVTDSALAVCSLPQSPLVEGLEHLPMAGSFLLVTNHCQRKDLWIGWSISLLIDSIDKQRSDHPLPHIVTTDRAVFDGYTVPGTPAIFERVALAWDLVLMTPAEAGEKVNSGSRHNALRQCLGLLRSANGRDVYFALAPEGLAGSAHGLGETVPGSGRSMLALANHGLPIVPAVVWEEAPGRLHACFGVVWQPDPSETLRQQRAKLDEWMREGMMRRLATLLPAELRGRYEPLEIDGHDGTLDTSDTGASF